MKPVLRGCEGDVAVVGARIVSLYRAPQCFGGRVPVELLNRAAAGIPAGPLERRLPDETDDVTDIDQRGSV